MKNVAIIATLISCFGAYAADLTQSALDDYVTEIKLSMSLEEHQANCQKLEFALASEQAKAMPDYVKYYAEDQMEMLCKESATLEASELEALIQDADKSGSKKACLDLDFALQAQNAVGIEGSLRDKGEKTLAEACR